MGDWVGVAIVLGAAFTLFVLKFIFIRCFFKGSRSRNDLSWVETHSPPARSYLQGNHLYFYPDHTVPSDFGGAHISPELANCFGRVKQKPPPSFEKALKCSTPVKLVNQVIVEVDEDDQDEPPPTYEECQTKEPFASCSTTNTPSSSMTAAVTATKPIQLGSLEPRTILTTEV